MKAAASNAHAARRWYLVLAVTCASLGAACGSASPDARYPSRAAGCPVKSYPGDPSRPVDDLSLMKLRTPDLTPPLCRRLPPDLNLPGTSGRLIALKGRSDHSLKVKRMRAALVERTTLHRLLYA